MYNKKKYRNKEPKLRSSTGALAWSLKDYNPAAVHPDLTLLGPLTGRCSPPMGGQHASKKLGWTANMMSLFCFVYLVLAIKAFVISFISSLRRGPRPNLWISKWYYVRGVLIQTGPAKHANAGYRVRRWLKCRRRCTEDNSWRTRWAACQHQVWRPNVQGALKKWLFIIIVQNTGLLPRWKIVIKCGANEGKRPGWCDREATAPPLVQFQWWIQQALVHLIILNTSQRRFPDVHTFNTIDSYWESSNIRLTYVDSCGNRHMLNTIICYLHFTWWVANLINLIIKLVWI